MTRCASFLLHVMLCLGVLLQPEAASGQAEHKSARAEFTVASPKIDGDLSDPAWRTAAIYGDFTERRPNLAKPPPDATTFSVLFDDEALYVGVRCYDHLPGDIRGRVVQRDSDAMFNDDTISIKLDPASDRRTTIGFALNAASGQLDYRGINESDFRVEFDAVWQGESRRNADGWTAEFRIPFASLGLNPADLPARVGLNLSRDHSRRNATYDWALMRPPFSPIAASRYGDLVGLNQRPVGRPRRDRELQWAVIPYLTGAYRLGRGTSNVDGSGGVDMRLQRGERLGMQLSINTDFSQVDLDDQRVNLTRFGLFFPEKRDFFLRDAELFSFGIPGEAQLLQTRRIGLSAVSNGQPVPLLDALKLIARPHSRLRLGMLQATSVPAAGQPWTMYLVGRGLVELAGGSNVGVMMTYRQSLERLQDRNLVLGVDGALRSFGNLLITAFAMFSVTGAESGKTALAAGGSGTGDAADRPAPGAGIEVSWRGLLWRPRVRYNYLDPQLRADLGFYRRVGIHDAQAELLFEPRLGRHGLERLTLDLGAEMVAASHPAQILDYRGFFDAALRWNIGFLVAAYASYNTETVQNDFEIGNGIKIPANLYHMWQGGIRAETPSVWLLSAAMNLRITEYYGGLQSLLNLSVAARPISGIRMTVSTELQRTAFQDERGVLLTASLNSQLGIGFSPTLGFDAFVAWNSVADLVRVQGRLRHRYRDGSDIFFVFQSDMDQAGRVHFVSLLMKMTFQVQR